MTTIKVRAARLPRIHVNESMTCPKTGLLVLRPNSTSPERGPTEAWVRDPFLRVLKAWLTIGYYAGITGKSLVRALYETVKDPGQYLSYGEHFEKWERRGSSGVLYHECLSEGWEPDFEVARQLWIIHRDDRSVDLRQLMTEMRGVETGTSFEEELAEVARRHNREIVIGK